MSRHMRYHLVLSLLQLLLQCVHLLTIPKSLNNTMNTFKDNQIHSTTKPYFDKYRQLSKQDHGQSDGNEKPMVEMKSFNGYTNDEQNITGSTGNDHEIKKTWNKIKQICGYYKMCFEEDKYFGFSLMPTCCQRCSCGASCSISNNCCPDVQLNNSEETMKGATCMTLYNVLMLADAEYSPEPDADQNADDSPVPDDEYNPVPDAGSPNGDDDDHSSNAECNPVSDAEDNPVPDAKGNPVPDAEDNPVPDAEANPIPDAEAYPVPDAEGNPVPDAEANPVPDAEANPVPDAEAYPVPDAEGNPVLDAEGNPVLDAEGNPVPDAEGNPVPDAEDNPVLDAEANPVSDAESNPVPDADVPNADNNPSSNADEIPVSHAEDNPVPDVDNPYDDDNNLVSDTDDNPVLDTDDKPASDTEDKSLSDTDDNSASDTDKSVIDTNKEINEEATDKSERNIEDISQDAIDDGKRQQKIQCVENYMKPTEEQQVHTTDATTQPSPDNQKHNKETSNDTVEDLQSLDIVCIDNSASESMLPTDKLYAKYVVISSCPLDYHNYNVIENCVRKNSPYTRDHIPVMDMINIEIYRNSYCAQCHNKYGYFPMDIVTNCTRLYLLDSVPTYVKDLRELTQDCLAYVDPTTNIQAESQMCRTEKTERRIISSCNATGQWEKYDSFVEDRCLTGEHMALYKDTSMRQTVTYKNIYCYLCNARTSKARTCEKHNHFNGKASTEPFESFKAYLSVTLPEHEDMSKILQGLNRPVLMPHLGTKSCMMGYIPDKYTEQCRHFICPLHKTPIYNICLKKNNKVWGLIVVGKIHVELTNSSVNLRGKDQIDINTLSTVIEQRIASYFQVQKSDCKHVPGEIFAQIEGQHLKYLVVKFKFQNTQTCSIETIVEMFAKIADEKVVLPQKKHENNGLPELSIQMTYQNLLEENFTFKVAPKTNKSLNHEVLLNASFFCPRVVLTVSEYQKFVEDGKLEILDNHILQQEYTKDTGLVEVCSTKYFRYWLTDSSRQAAARPDFKSTLEVTLSAIATIISMLSITAVIITFCLFSELRFIPGKLALIICFNLLFAQSFYAFGLDLGVDNVWCKLIGMCIHFFWLASIFSMNSILFLMLRSFHKPLHADNRVIIQSRSTTEITKYILHCYFMPLVCVIINCLSSTLHITEEFGYGGTMCYIRTAKMRLFTFAVPIGMVMLTNITLFGLIMFSLQKFMKSVNEKVPIKQIYIFFKLITMTGMYWLFGFLYELTRIKLFSYLFIVLNAGQGFFLMWTFLHNSQVFNLYKNAITKYIKKFKKETSQSYSLS